jgi:hypothetical protein
VLGSIAAGCGSSQQSSTITGGASTAGGAAGAGGETPIFSNGGQGGAAGNAGGANAGAAGSTAGVGGGGPSGGGSGTDGGTSTSACGASIAGLGDCGAQSLGATIKHPNMLIVLDKSGSTQSTPTGFTGTIWDGLKTALSSALNGAKDKIAFGLDLFPAPGVPYECKDKCCVMPTSPDVTVPVEPGDTGVPKIVAALDATAPGGGTPTAAALARAYDYYTSGPGAGLDGDKYVLLATDGGPNCNSNLNCDSDVNKCTLNLEHNCTNDPTVNCCARNGAGCVDDQSVIDQINKLAGAGVKTFVVGIPGSQYYSNFLDAFAVAGGVPNPAAPPSYYRVDAASGEAGLTKVFTDITQQLLTSCEIELHTTPSDPDLVNVAIDCQVVPSNGTDGTDGWILDQTTDPQKIVLQGTLCSWVQQQGARNIDVVFGCRKITDLH